MASKVICDVEELMKKVTLEMCVEFNNINDPEAREILSLLESRGLKTFSSIYLVSKKTIDPYLIHFFIRATISPNFLFSKFGRSEIKMYKKDVSDIFHISMVGGEGETYKLDEYMESFKLIARRGCQNVASDFKKNHLSREYILLLDIVSNVILGENQSFDVLPKR